MNNEVEEELLRNLIGMTETTGRGLCELYRYTTRVTIKDGKAYVGTCDLRFDRINLQLKTDPITGDVIIIRASVG